MSYPGNYGTSSSYRSSFLRARKTSISNTGSGNSFSNTASPFEYTGRSYVMSGVNPSHFGSPAVHSNYQVDEQTAIYANIGVTEDKSSEESVAPETFDHSRLLSSEIMETSHPIDINHSFGTSSDSRLKSFYDEESQDGISDASQLLKPLKNSYINDRGNLYIEPSIDYAEVGSTQYHVAPKSLKDRVLHSIWKPFNYLPAVFLGTLLNILDGLSYGMIMFPVSDALFSSLGPAGLSMFYVSCIVSQLVYSLGGSAFKSGIGSEMIEVTPFFHTMALAIMRTMGPENKDAVIATTVVTYAVSSIVTGLIFFLLGKFRLGSLVGFFPRHILVGCIGGVGYFLIVTGIEVSSRLDGSLEYNRETFNFLFGDYVVFLRWFLPLALAAVLILLQHKIHNSLLVPGFFAAVFIIFHIVVKLVPSWSLDLAKEYGWVFPTVGVNEPWYGFYELYKFSLVDWWVILEQLPTMLALTFFGILHVPINVPALAITVGMDQYDVDRELVAHGYSNALSGLVGSIQNYLVYTNSVLFIRAGADDRVAGVMLAIATGAIMMVGPVIIGYIPICVVGSLIYLLGYELLKEALYDTWGRVRKIEYTTILIIVLVMGAWDFVYGVFAGILLACLSFVVEAATTPVVQGIYTGVVARSTVLRHPKQQDFLKDVGNQICVVKLQGTLFFGSIGGVEKAIRNRFEVDSFLRDPVKFLILDMKGVVSIDFSAAEGFRRVLNLCNEFETQLIISSVENNDDTVKALKDAGLWDVDSKMTIQLFNSLNYALEWCESSFLATYKSVLKHQKISSEPYDSLGMTRHKSIVDSSARGTMGQFEGNFSSTPRTTQVYQAATRTARDEQGSQSRYFTSTDASFKKQPLPLLMITFQGLSDKDQQFWSHATGLFTREQIPENYTFYDTSRDEPGFFVVETGLIKSVLRFEDKKNDLISSVLPMTAFGDLFEKDQQARSTLYTTVSDSVVWKLPYAKIQKLVSTPEGLKIYNELLVINNRLLHERFDTMTANLLLS